MFWKMRGRAVCNFIALSRPEGAIFLSISTGDDEKQ
jgi:hypothetical protein